MRYCPYWVFLSTGQHYDLALQTEGGSLTILSTKTNDYRDIEVSTASIRYGSISKYKYNGKKYINSRYCEWGYDDTDEKIISCSDVCQMDAESERKPNVLNINLTILFGLSLFLMEFGTTYCKLIVQDRKKVN